MQLIRCLALLSPLVFLAVTGCDSADSSPPGELLTVGFGDVLENRQVIQLRPDSTDPVGDITALTLWRDYIVIADGLQANVKLFRRDGTLHSTLGRVGDGPAEFRFPTALAVVGDELFVLDGEMRISAFDSSGTYLGRFQAPGSRGKAFQTLGEGRFLLSSRTVERDGATYGVQVINDSGERLSALHPVEDVTERYRRNFLNVRAVQVGDYVVSLDETTNRLTRSALTNGDRQEVLLDADWYRPPQWLENPASLRELTDWANRQMWARILLPLGETEVLAGFSTYDHERQRADFYYVIVDVELGTQLVLRESVNAGFRAARGDTLVAAQLDDRGKPIVQFFVRKSQTPG